MRESSCWVTSALKRRLALALQPRGLFYWINLHTSTRISGGTPEDSGAPTAPYLKKTKLYYSFIPFLLRVFQVSAVLSELISEIFGARLDTGCSSLGADGAHMMLWPTCLSSLPLLLLSTAWLKRSAFNPRSCTLIVNSGGCRISERSWESTRPTVFWMWKIFSPPVTGVQPRWCMGSRWGKRYVGQ